MKRKKTKAKTAKRVTRARTGREIGTEQRAQRRRRVESAAQQPVPESIDVDALRATVATTSSVAEWASALSTLDAVATASERVQKAVKRWYGRRVAGRTFNELTGDDVRALVRDCGRSALAPAAQILGVTLDALTAKYPAKRESSSAQTSRLSRHALDEKVSTAQARGRARADAAIATTGKVIDLMDVLKTSLASSAIAGAAAPLTINANGRNFDGPHELVALQRDESRAVRLDSLSAGMSVKTPDSPDEGLAGQYATIVRVGAGSVVVRLGSTRKTIRERGTGEALAEFDAPGRPVQWAASTMVVPLSTENAT